MYGILLIGVGLVILGVVGAVVWLVYLLFQPAKKKNAEASDVPQINNKPAPKGGRVWILYIVIALILAIWTIWGALFFFFVVWVMRLNPKIESQAVLTEKDTRITRNIYRWLWFALIIGAPWFVITTFGLYSISDINERFFGALLPAILYSPVLFYLLSKSLFIYRHAQQAILLIGLRVAMAGVAIIIVQYPENGLWLFLLGNGSLWLFGNLWARNQVIRGECWLMQRKGETILTPESQTSDDHVTDKKLDGLLKSMNLKDRDIAYEKSLKAFRTGTPEARKRAVAVLSALSEVEKF